MGKTKATTPSESRGMNVLRALDRKKKGQLALFRQMFAERTGGQDISGVSDYLAMVIEEADFSLECDLVSTSADIKLGKNPIDLREADEDDLRMAAAAARYSADLWIVAAKLRRLRFEPTKPPARVREKPAA